MFTFNDLPGPQDNLDTAIAIQQAKWESERRDHRLRELAKINHGHEFGRNMRCECGIFESQYRMMPVEERQPCGVAVERLKGREPIQYAGEFLKDGYLTEKQVALFQSGLPTKCCWKCRFWKEHEPPTADLDLCAMFLAAAKAGSPSITHDGDCRRHAPFNVEDGWPKTGCRDWCGDFELEEA